MWPFFTTLGHCHSSTCLLASCVHIIACLSSTLLPALVPLKGAGSYHDTPPGHFHFLWFLRCLILCFVPLQIMCFSDLFLCCSSLSFGVIMKIVLKSYYIHTFEKADNDTCCLLQISFGENPRSTVTSVLLWFID